MTDQCTINGQVSRAHSPVLYSSLAILSGFPLSRECVGIKLDAMSRQKIRRYSHDEEKSLCVQAKRYGIARARALTQVEYNPYDGIYEYTRTMMSKKNSQ